MNKMFKLALSVVLGATLVAPAMAQSNFPDVPTDHWAYEALRNLKDKVLFGYPNTDDYKGNRPMSRYEFAVAADKLYQIMMGRFAGIEDQISALEKEVAALKGGTPGDTSGLAAQLAELRKLVDGKADKSAVDDVRKLVGEFEKELADLGRDVDDMKKDLSDLERRVDELEKRKPAVDIHGDVNLLILGAHSSDDKLGLGWWGTYFGNGRGDYAGVPVGATRDLSILHEANLVLSGTNTEGPQWKAGLTIGNMYDSIGNYNHPASGAFREEDTSVYLNSLSVTFDHQMLGQNMKAELGRVGHMISPYILKRSDYTPFYDNARWDDGKHYFDGGILTFNFGNTALNLFGGRNSNRTTNNGSEINPIYLANSLPIDQTFGADLSIPLGDTGSLRLSYLFLDSNQNNFIAVPGPNNQSGNVNRVNVYGADLNLKFGDIKLAGHIAKSDLSENTDNKIDEDNMAWDISLGYAKENWGLHVGGRRVEENFTAPGSWGRLGLYWNPTNIQGFNAGVWFKPSNDLKIWAKGEFVEGIEDNGGITGISLDEDDKIDSIRVGVDYRLGPTWNVSLSYEDVRFKFANADDSKMNWFDLNFGWQMGQNAMFRLGYIYSDADFSAGQRYKGGLITTQVSVKF